MAKRVSKAKQRFKLLETQLKRIRQSTVKGLRHELDLSAEDCIYLDFYWGVREVIEITFYLPSRGRKIVCKASESFPVEWYAIAPKVYRHASKFVRIYKELA